MEHWQIILITTGVQIIIGLFVMIIAFLMKRSINQIDERLKDGDNKFDTIRADIVELQKIRGMDREYFAKEYVSKDDFIRDIRALDVKIDGVAADVKELLRTQKEKP